MFGDQLPLQPNIDTTTHNIPSPTKKVSIKDMKPFRFSIEEQVYENTFTSCHRAPMHYYHISERDKEYMTCTPIKEKTMINTNTQFVICSSKAENIYVNLTTISQSNGKTSVIEKFEDGVDKIYLFENDTTLSFRDIILTVNRAENFTMLSVDYGSTIAGIAILGEHPELLSDVVLNEAYA